MLLYVPRGAGPRASAPHAASCCSACRDAMAIATSDAPPPLLRALPRQAPRPPRPFWIFWCEFDVCATIWDEYMMYLAGTCIFLVHVYLVHGMSIWYLLLPAS
ncbi:hypothetical protein BRADI_1g05655v3 [Brachypodium distachyon]|uniref:Uncharacterized protein n=1 Tax=Brachypodium distachyon TaxID=15368 RepID=A0A2K2DI65_BRADI|nr:hypothetical protein BRADI_1g05655v3 [Brachypodium distachyon]